MIRSATNADSEPIAKALWQSWHHLKARQIATPLPAYASSEILADEICRDLSRWLVCESSNSQKMGFFAFSRIGTDKTYKRWRFPERAVRIEHFACLLSGEVLLPQFESVASHLREESILLCFASPLREACWAALKAGFRLLGESPLIVGKFAWLYLDREERFGEIQMKLRRAKIVIVEPDGTAKGGPTTRLGNSDVTEGSPTVS
jgi:hypothetical protein